MSRTMIAPRRLQTVMKESQEEDAEEEEAKEEEEGQEEWVFQEDLEECHEGEGKKTEEEEA